MISISQSFDSTKWRFFKFSLSLSFIFFCCLIISFMQNFTLTRYLLPLYRNRKPPVKKLILFYTSFFGSKPWCSVPALTNYSRKCGCHVYDGECNITYDQKLFNSSDMVFFHGRDMPDLRPIHNKRPRNQLWTYFIMESPVVTPNIVDIDQYFNMTSSYRLNSDIRRPYRNHRKKDNQTITMRQQNYAKGKTKQIAWAVSNCGQPRDQLAKKLHEYGLTIDNFGRCSAPYLHKRHIPRNRQVPYNEYKFYFAAENRLCNDYITEKYWVTGLDANVIPIVFGGSNYSDPNLAIPGSFIDALKFPSPKKLAEYLFLLDKNDTLYNEYFKWKVNWALDDFKCDPECTRFLCDVCEKVHSNLWVSRHNPLISTINVETECGAKERFFREWIKR